MSLGELLLLVGVGFTCGVAATLIAIGESTVGALVSVLALFAATIYSLLDDPKEHLT